jgi:hypothetical protein
MLGCWCSGDFLHCDNIPESLHSRSTNFSYYHVLVEHLVRDFLHRILETTFIQIRLSLVMQGCTRKDSRPS